MSNRNEDLEKLYALIELAMNRLNEQALSVYGVSKFAELERLIKQALTYIEYTQKCGYFFPYKSIKGLLIKWDSFKDFFTIDHENYRPENSTIIRNILNDIKELTFVELKNYSFNEVKKKDLKNLLDLIESEFFDKNIDYPPNFNKLVIDVYTNELSDNSVKEKIIRDLLEAQNKFINYSMPSIHTISELYFFLRNYELELNKAEFSNQVKEHNAEIKEVRGNLGLRENERLIHAYKTEAEKYKKSISNYTYSIIFLFSVISALILFNIIIYKNDYDWHKYVFFVTFIFSLTGFLAFLIKERSRLVTLQTYCIKNYLELTALPDYMAELTKEQAQALRVDLAKSYFKGYEDNQTSSNDEKSITQVSNNVDQLVKSIGEIKNLLSK
ncbi:hypothetical protein R4447_00345 [Acinetobacter baumannii]|nr:hypothetical protein [Acinetobacter baumannii]